MRLHRAELDAIPDPAAQVHRLIDLNVLEQVYPWTHRITCCGIGPCPEFNERFPGATYTPIVAGAPLPFPDHAFDVAFSNAVLEHVGTDQDRSFVVSELLRVSRRVFIAVPNRWFPVEHHTGIPLLHYAPQLFRRFVRGGSLDHWSRPEDLSFIGRREVATFWPAHVRPNKSYAGLRCGPLSSNLLMCT